MASSPGLVWGSRKTPSDLAVQVSTIRDELTGNVERIVGEFLQEAVEEMRQSIKTRGVKAGVPTGQGRIATGDMLNAVDSVLSYTRAGRVSGKFGWLNDQMKYFAFQEYGTRGGQGNGRGILEMLALTDAFQNFERKMQDAFDNGRVLNLKQGRYAG